MEATDGDGLRVLAGAYACAPPGSETMHGGEELLGWRMAEQIGRLGRADVLVSGEHRRSIESAPAPEGLSFRYVNLPTWLAPLRQIQGGVQLYAYLWQVKAWLVARRLAAGREYDLYHHLTYANDWMASYPGALLDLPYVRGPGGGAHRVPRALLGNYGPRFRAAQWLRSALQRLLRADPVFRIGQRKARALFLCTRASLEALPGRHREKARLMPVVGVTEEEFDVEPEPVSGDFTAVAPGKLLPHKGFDLAVRAFAKFCRRSGGGRLLVAGDGPERESLVNLARSLGVSSRVEFGGWVLRDRLLRLMAGADITLFPSLRDGGGAVVVESMAVGTPVVCLDVAGPGIHVTEETGCAVRPGDAEETVERLAEALITLARHPDRRRELGKRARERAWEHYRWSRRGEQLRTLYRSLRSGREKGSR